MRNSLYLFFLYMLLSFCGAINLSFQNTHEDNTTWQLLKQQSRDHQNNNNDSLLFFLNLADSFAGKHHLTYEDELSLHNAWGNYYVSISSADSAIYFLKKAVATSDTIGNDAIFYEQIIRLADAFNNNYIADSALKYYRMALIYYQDIDDSLAVASALSGIASALIESGIYNDALEKLHEAENIYKNTSKHRELGIIYNNIALINARLGYEPKILQYGKMAIHQYLQADDTALLADGYANLGVSFKNSQLYDSALLYYHKSNELADAIGSKWLLAKNLHNMGVLFDEMDKPDEAFENYTASLKICTEENFPFGEFNNSVNLGDFALDQQDHQLAIRYFERARTLGREFGFDMLGQVYHKLHLAHCGSGNDKQALEYLRMHMHFKDSLFEAQKHKEVMELQTRFETQKKEAQILKLEKEKQSEALLRAYLLLGVVGVVIVALLLLLRSRRKQAEVRQNNLKIEKENQQKKNQIEKLLLEKQLQEKAAEKYRLQLMLKEQELVYHTLKEAGLKHLIRKIKAALIPFTYLLAKKKDQEKFTSAIEEISRDASQDPLADFEEMFLQMHDDFYEKILKINPDFTRSELQMAALLRMNLPSKEIARLLNLALSTIDKRRHSIRKKLDLSPDQSLTGFLIGL